jgi:hypothetical protein
VSARFDESDSEPHSHDGTLHTPEPDPNTVLLKQLLNEQRQANQILDGIRWRLTPVAVLAWMGITGGGLWLLLALIGSSGW